MPRPISRRALTLALTGIAGLSASRAQAIQPPAGKVILTIAGRIGQTNAEGAAVFDRDMLEAFGMQSFTTQTPWYNGPVSFEGVPLAKLMQSVGAAGERVTALALNDYSTDIPMEDFAKYNVLLALKRDGQYMPVKDKGPLFIVYPYDSAPELKHQKFYSRSAWQVARLLVK